MRTSSIILIVVLTVAAFAYAGWKISNASEDEESFVLGGNIDLRQIDLPFNAQQRVASVLVEEGDRVGVGQLVAKLETNRLQAAADEAAARVAAQKRVVERLENGTRREEIDQARANLESADADLADAVREYERFKRLDGTGAASGKEVDSARFAYESAVAKQHSRQHALTLSLAGPRAEEKAEAKATLSALESQLVLRQRELADAELRSPVVGVIRNRILEPGEMSSPNTPALTIAVTDPKWVRAYVQEKDLGKVRPGVAAVVTVDAYPSRKFHGWVGFVSPSAEFTPKNVETPELRTSLLYEVRIFFRDPGDALRLGMPATVKILPNRVSHPTTNASK